MWCPEPLNTHRNHTHTHTEVLWSRHESLDLRLKNTPPASCLQLSDAVNNQHRPSVWVCENRCIPPAHTHTHAHTNDVEANFCWSRSSAALRRHVKAKRTQMNRGSRRVTFSKNVPESDHVMWPSGREWWESIELKEAKWKSCFHHHTAFTRTDRGDVRSARNEPK